MYTNNMIAGRWISDDLHIHRQADKNWIVSFQFRGILNTNRRDELNSIFSCLLACMDFPCGIVFNFSCIDQLNESELESFLSIATPFLKRDCQVVLCNLSVQVLELFEKRNLDEQFPLAAEQEDALFAMKFNSEAVLEPESSP